jgi:hypothetical protein
LYAFDPRRTAILLIIGDKTGDDRWYKEFETYVAEEIISEKHITDAANIAAASIDDPPHGIP